MTWFRAGSSVAKLAIRRTLSQGVSNVARTRALPSGNRHFHTTISKLKAQSAPVPRAVPLSRLTDSFLDGTSSVYLEELQRAWEADPNSVDESWDNFFRNFVGQAATTPGISGQTIQESMRLLLLVRAYQVYGHMKANLDPLGLEPREIPDDLDPALYGFTEADLDREFFLGVWRMSGFLSENRPVQTLRAILTRLEQAYCGSIGFEYMHIADREQCNWLRDRIETPIPMAYNRQRKEVILDRLIWSTQFENFLATKWTAAKRFGLEGGETLIPGMKEMFDRSADLGVESIVIGMSHRGRLNVLVVHACELAAEWRQTFHTDVVVDIVCYRRFGHNEIDEPSFTQPKMYKVIRNHPSALEIYQKKLLETGQVTKEDIDKIHNKVTSILNEEFLASKDYVPQKGDWLSAFWSGFKSPEQLSRIRNTGVKPEILKNVGKAITTLPENFKPHRAVKKIFADRLKMIETGEGVDWAVGEALAFATLLVEGNHVRLSGQDVERGTFSHRHSVVHDQETGERYCPLGHVVMNQNEEMFTVSNSSLSEFGVLGFELGYSMENPNSLVIWEAQFGDFANGAQVIFDQFLSSGESKWLRQIGLVVLLPHGYDGQGPEHSSARLERFLQMSDDNPFVIPEMEPTLRDQIQKCNWQVVNVTTPANYFHVLRRQIHREFRKPLIVMAPKNLLRHKDCKSNLSEFDDVQGHPGFDKQGTRFKRLIKDQSGHSDLEEGIRRLVLCSGKVYYELDEKRKSTENKDVAICRVEQLCPFPYDLIQRELKRYPNAEIVWCQEEPMNMGAYNYIAPRLATAMKALDRGNLDNIKYVGRGPSAATATGFYTVHVKEQAALVEKAITSDSITNPTLA
ncbi:putative oxoglutarate dehydrogenase (succinyl-transferring) [Helianthus debilis subsp. tardiflorus]